MPADRLAETLRRVAPAGLLYGSFAFVMATGIVSIAAGLVGLGPLSMILFVVNAIAFPLLWALLAARLLLDPAAFAADAFNHQLAPRSLTMVAATCVVGNQVALIDAGPGIVFGLWVLAAVLWTGLIYCFFAAMTIRPVQPSLDSDIDGSWLLVVVATEALAILTTRIAGAIDPPLPALFASLCLFLLGGAFYLILLTLIVYRWLFLPMRPDQLTPAYWINMGAAAISALAGVRLLSTVGMNAAMAPFHGFVAALTIVFWSLATWWIPLLAVLTWWRHRGANRLGYSIDNWAIVFPLGMYTTATWRVAHETGFPFLAVVPEVTVWVALAAWGLTFFGMVRAAMRVCRGNRATV